jgi:hypothetical protein
LHVETEHRQYFMPIAIGLRHIEQTAKPSAMCESVPIVAHAFKRGERPPAEFEIAPSGC